MGASFVPRIGQEVVVRFLEGDGDRPLVTGAVFNGANGVPLQLPSDRTRSTMRTDSSPGSGGSNELRFEDLAGAEEVYAHAQKDANGVVEHDTAARVGHDAALQVGQDRRKRVGRDHDLAVAASDESAVGGNQTLQVSGHRDTAAAGSHGEEVGGNQAVSVGGHRNLVTAGASVDMVGAADTLKVGLVYTVQVGAMANVAVGGLRSVQVAGMRTESVAEDRYEKVARNASARVGGDLDADVEGGVGMAADEDGRIQVGGSESWEAVVGVVEDAKELNLKADKFVLMVGGKKILELTSSGVKLSGSSVAVGGTAVALKGSPIGKSAGAPPPGGSARVKVLKAIKREGGSARVTVLDDAGMPLAGLRWRAKLSDGSEVEGTTNGDGVAIIPAKPGKSPKVTFPTLDAESWKEK